MIESNIVRMNNWIDLSIIFIPLMMATPCMMVSGEQ
jgi:hypothetical protein